MINKVLTKYKHWKRGLKIRREKPELWLIEKGKIGYIQIPKVATRSIQACLARHYAELNKEVLPEVWSKEEIRRIESKTASHISQEKILYLSSDVFIFAFVRNPYDRLYSAYKNKVMQPLNSGGKNIFANHGVSLGISFRDFVDFVISIPDVDIDRHLRSQSWFLTFKGSVIPSYIGHLETFDKDWTELNAQFKLGSPPHENSTKNVAAKGFQHQYDIELEEKVFNRYKEDFKYFGYERLRFDK